MAQPLNNEQAMRRLINLQRKRIAELTEERDRQYEFNAGQIAKNAQLQKEIDKGDLLSREYVRVSADREKLKRQLSAFNSGGFADADALAEKYLDLKAENDKLKIALADIQEIAERETSNESALLTEITQCSMDALASIPSGKAGRVR